MKESEKFKYLNNFRVKLDVVIFGTDTRMGRLFDVILLYVILVSIVLVMLESVQSYNLAYGDFFNVFEWFFTLFFTFEYITRLWISRKPLNYVFSFFGIIDLIAVIPTYLTLFYVGGSYLVVVRAVRLLRVFRILKLSRQISESRVIVTALVASRHKIIVFLGAVLTLAVIMGTLMYMIEGGENGFDNIPRSIYWAIVTITTVGYGDITPGTVFGQSIAALLMLMGYAIIAVPTGIVSSEINKASKKMSEEINVLCSCGKRRHFDNARYCFNCGTVLDL